VVALGLDASEKDPLAGLAVTTDGFRRIGEGLARFGLPTVLVQEGGYLSDILGGQFDGGARRVRVRTLDTAMPHPVTMCGPPIFRYKEVERGLRFQRVLP